MKRWWIIIAALGTIGLIGVVVLVIAPKKIIPNSIASELTSTLFVPVTKNVAATRASVKYDTSLKLLTFNVQEPETKLTISEQPTPDAFTDVPTVYEKVIDSMNGYNTFDSPMGTVDLTLPKQGGSYETAVMNAKGTLMFVKSSKNLTDDQWKQFFLGLSIQS